MIKVIFNKISILATALLVAISLQLVQAATQEDEVQPDTAPAKVDADSGAENKSVPDAAEAATAKPGTEDQEEDEEEEEEPECD